MGLKVRNRTLPEGTNVWAPTTLISTWFGVGLIGAAPGTWGSAFAVPLGILLLYVGGPVLTLVVAVVIFFAGLYASHKLIASFPEGSDTDNSAIVVDEVAGQLIAIAPALFSPPLWIASFLLFRFFDVSKLGPTGWLERRLKGAMGVMVDDVSAGIMAALCVWGLSALGLGNVW
jgi:phosphatidylglycerophosphatase A